MLHHLEFPDNDFEEASKFFKCNRADENVNDLQISELLHFTGP